LSNNHLDFKGCGGAKKININNTEKVFKNNYLFKTMGDEYEHVAKGKLKLKTDSDISKKKKKKKSKDKDKEMEKISQTDASTVKFTDNNHERKLTQAELSFKKMQEKMQKKRIMEKASTTHKQQVCFLLC
jgi:protein FAM32A